MLRDLEYEYVRVLVPVQISMLHAMLRAATSQGFETNLDHIRINDVVEDIL